MTVLVDQKRWMKRRVPIVRWSEAFKGACFVKVRKTGKEGSDDQLFIFPWPSRFRPLARQKPRESRGFIWQVGEGWRSSCAAWDLLRPLSPLSSTSKNSIPSHSPSAAKTVSATSCRLALNNSSAVITGSFSRLSYCRMKTSKRTPVFSMPHFGPNFSARIRARCTAIR